MSLVGAGPGDPGLITVRGLQLLRRADVVVHDALVSEALLVLARPEARRIDVGKRGGAKQVAQQQINDLLLLEARRGFRVVRLKGGDPYLFGRGAEEASSLGRHGVGVEVVPGVTAGLAAAVTAGIPLTHREHAGCVALVTGHEDPAGARPAVEPAALAALVRGGGTVCYYMAVARLAALVEALKGEGLPGDTPVGIVESATLPEQRVVRSTLARASVDARDRSVRSPAVVVIGDVASIDDPGLQWFSRRPLSGRRVVVTRSRSQGSRLSRRFARLGATVLEASTIAIDPVPDTTAVDGALDQIGDFDWITLSSVNGVAALEQGLKRCGRDARALAGLKVAAVGRATARALRGRLGIRADLVPKTFHAEALAHAMIDAGIKGKRVMLLRADLARPTLARLLRAAAATVQELVVYQTRRAENLPEALLDALRGGRIDWVTFASSTTAKNMIELLGPDAALLADVKLASIGNVTSRTIRELGFEPEVEADPQNMAGLVRGIVQWENGRGDV